MGWILLIALLLPISTALDPCDNCPIPGAFTQQDYINCGREPDSGSEYAPAFIRYSLGSECYLQMMDCPGYDVATLSYCSSMARPEQALRCIAGRFFSSEGMAISNIRCNNGSDTSPVLFSNNYCEHSSLPTELSAADESACGSVGSTTQAIEMSTSYNGSKCVLTLSGCDSYNVVSGYDGTGICRTEENVVAINENGKFKLNNRYIYQVRCANPDSSQASCNGLGWKYYWATDYYFKIGFHKTYNEAKADCIAEGGQLASVHGEDENLFILLIALMSTSQHEPNFNIWLGIESDGNGGWVNVDGTPFDYNSWSSESPSGDGNCVRMSTLDVMEMPWYNVPCSADTATYACKKKGPCSFKEMLEEWRFQSCFNGGSLKLGETLEIRGKAPTVAPGDVWSINLETSSNAHALHILITEWGTDQPVIRIMSALNGFVETARYDCPYRPGVNYTFQVQNSEDQLRLIFNELDIQHPHFVSNPAEDYWAVAITIPYAIPQLYSAVITNGGIVDELGLGDTEALDEDEPVICTSCPPLTQKPTDLEGALDSILSATYDSSTGCMKASITCTATASGKYVGLFSNENLGFGNRCGTVNYTNAYTCGSNGVWLDLNEQEAMPLVECIEIPDDNC